MTDEEIWKLLQQVMRNHNTPEDAASQLDIYLERDSGTRIALCRYVINRMVPLKGTVG